ncbi:protein of unknown function [Nitrospira japonica]|uniref:Uncharacterized protein n=1 Tax=Nitrospira japonica TaxID=1325564 RepID=A0A1W1I5Y7_9BACT|nr:protein of unknown function [Nitrospira japonica]
METLEFAILELRVRALYHIARLKGLKTTAGSIRLLASELSDSEIMSIIQRKNAKWWNLYYWG